MSESNQRDKGWYLYLKTLSLINNSTHASLSQTDKGLALTRFQRYERWWVWTDGREHGQLESWTFKVQTQISIKTNTKNLPEEKWRKWSSGAKQATEQVPRKSLFSCLQWSEMITALICDLWEGLTALEGFFNKRLKVESDQTATPPHPHPPAVMAALACVRRVLLTIA